MSHPGRFRHTHRQEASFFAISSPVAGAISLALPANAAVSFDSTVREVMHKIFIF